MTLRFAAAGVVATGLLAEPPPAVAAEAGGEATPPASAAPQQPAYWQVPPLPQAVIQGGAIPPGWQPQAVPYQGVGPDGKPLTMFYAPTYVFTYQVGPPVPAVPQVSRRGWWSGPSPAAAPTATGWNYATSGAQPVTTTLPPGAATQYRPVYQFPPDARALQGTELVPPGPLPSAPLPQAATWPAQQPLVPQQPPVQQPPSQWVPSGPQPNPQPMAQPSPPASPAWVPSPGGGTPGS